MAGWLLGLRSGIVLAGLCLAAGALFALAETAGFLPPTSPAPTLLLWFVQGLVYLTAAVLIAFVLHRYKVRFDQARKLGEDLAEEHAFLETLMNTQSDAGQAILIVESGRIAFANEAAGGLFGYGRNELLALPGFLELVHPDDRERLSRNYRRRLRGERFENKYRVSILTRSGERRETELTAARMPGEAPRVLCVFADITEQEAATRALREQHALYETLLRAQSDAGLGMCIVEGNRIVFANDAFCGLFGMSRQEIEALPSYATLLHPDDRERVRSNYERRLRGEQFENRYRIAIVTQAGERREAEMTVVYISTPTPRVLIIIKDVTDSVRAEAARQHAEEEVRHLNADLERRVQERTAELTAANRELESFAYSISH
ncbi:MAG: hypothetical protein DPW12_16245, partial [Rhodocyclaceae bacterium]|nr:hypothetical protein [Rhodocyclaceae bacterium]